MLWVNYLKIAIRHQLRNKGLSLINILGLAIGLTAFFFIYQYASFELNYDSFHSKRDQIYRVIDKIYQEGRPIQNSTMTYPAVGSVLAKDYEEVLQHTRILTPFGESMIKVHNNFYVGDNCLFADENFFSVFDFTVVAGQTSALYEKYTAILSESIAKKYFGEADVQSLIGREFLWSVDKTPYVIKAICKDIPENSHLQFDVLLSYASLFSQDNRSFDESLTTKPYVRHYLLLNPETDYKALERKMEFFSKRYFAKDEESGKVHAFTLQPLEDVHLYSSYEYEYAKTASGKVVWAMIWIAGFTLIIAWINYVNLTTSRSLDRAKEVGVRKVMGANITQLMKQFVLESVFVIIISLLLAILWMQLLQQPFNEIIGGNRSLWSAVGAIDFTEAIILVAVILIGLVISGFYPAFILSSFQAAIVLKGKFQGSPNKGQIMHKTLVVFQFTTSCVLMIATFVVSSQMDFMREKDIGITIKNTMIVSAPMRASYDSTYQDRVKTFKHALAKFPQVSGVTTSSHLPGMLPYTTSGIQVNGAKYQYTANQITVDEDFLNNYEVDLIAGRMFVFSDCNFDWNKTRNMIINRTAMERFDLTMENALQAKIYIEGKEWTVVGVVEDFHQQSLHSIVEPVLFTPDYGVYNPISIKLKGNDYQLSIVQVRTLYEKFFPENAFKYYFLEDQFNSQYTDDRKFNVLTKIFTILAIVISCLGLIGLSAYTTLKRTKEIGIRKVIGASTINIVSLLSLNFIKLVLLATVLSIPLAYIGMREWLSHYAYRITPNVFMYAIPLVGILLIAIGTICTQVLKAAKRNPARTLKYE